MFGQLSYRSRTRACQGSAVLLLACCLALSGCGRARPIVPEVPAQPWEGKATRVLEQDVGVMRHGQKVRRRFTITNDSGSKWTLSRFRNGCACTASQPLTKQVLPGGSMAVDVDYTADRLDSDDRRRVGVEFVEENAPFVWLEIRACIRAPISVFPAHLMIVPARRGCRESAFEIHNVTDHDVHALLVRSSTPWLRRCA